MTKASTPRIAASEPGQSAPAPSAAQKVPKVVSITPTANFTVFSGTAASGARTSDAGSRDDGERGGCAGGRERNAPLRAAERQHDERHLEPFEQDALEGEHEPVEVEARAELDRGAPCLLELMARRPPPRRAAP